MSTNQYYRKGVGQYRRYKVSHASIPIPTIPIPNQSNPQASVNSSSPTTSPNLIEQIRTEWHQNNINTEQLDKLEGLWNALQSEVARTQINNVMNRIKSIAGKIPLREVVNVMSNNDKLSELLKNLSPDGNSSEALQNMMNDPNLRKTAMDMMQDIMNDEKKFAEMTEMMTKMLNQDNK